MRAATGQLFVHTFWPDYRTIGASAVNFLAVSRLVAEQHIHASTRADRTTHSQWHFRGRNACRLALVRMDRSSATILIVDDEPVVLEFANRAFTFRWLQDSGRLGRSACVGSRRLARHVRLTADGSDHMVADEIIDPIRQLGDVAGPYSLSHKGTAAIGPCRV